RPTATSFRDPFSYISPTMRAKRSRKAAHCGSPSLRRSLVGQAPEHHGRLKAIATMLLAVAAFSGMDSMLKLFSAHYPPMQIAFLRGLASLPFTLLPSLLRGRYRDLKPTRLGMHLLRGTLMVVMLGGFIYAVRTLSLAN